MTTTMKTCPFTIDAEAIARGMLDLFTDDERVVSVPSTSPTRTKETAMSKHEKTEYEKLYNVFVRTWWSYNTKWPGGKEPSPGKRRYLKRRVTYAEAMDICSAYNSTHEPGPLSKKCEFEEA